MPENLFSISFEKVKELITNQIMDTLKDLSEEEKGKLLSRWEQNIDEHEDDIWYTHTNSVGKRILLGYRGNDVNVIFPDTIDGDFYEISGIACRRSQIESITISKGVTLIDRHAFAHCDKLKKVTFVDGFSGTIMSSAFMGCSSLEEFTFPPNIKVIEPIVNRCQSLSTVYIPNTVIKITAYALSENENLENIYFDGTKAAWKALDKGYRWNFGLGNYTIYCLDGKIPMQKKSTQDS